VLRFTPAVAARVLETTWHPTQRVEAADDGSLTWRATVAGTIEVRLWILSWGDDVEVVEPETLRLDVASTHRRAAIVHGG
jgi:predicted DNA-binding transcriptional regulator YafY